MRRKLGLVVAVVILSLAQVAGTAGMASADYSQSSVMVGHVDAPKFFTTPERGGQITVSGWALDRNHRASTRNMVEVTETEPSGRVTYGDAINFRYGRSEAAKAYPGAGLPHGFLVPTIVSGPGKYTFCVKAMSLDYASDSSASWTQLGCTSIVVVAEKMAGAIESVAVDNATPSSGFWVKGWVADTWDGSSAGYGIDYTVDSEGAIQVPVHNTGSGQATSKRADIEVGHPLAGVVKGFAINVDVDQSGTYRVCATAHNFATGTHVSIGCMAASFTAVKAGTQPVITGVPTVGSTLSASTSGWGPAPIALTYVWFSRGGKVVAEGPTATSYTVTTADVGWPINVFVYGSKVGFMPLSQAQTAGYGSIAGVTVSRVSGIDRFATSIAISKSAYPDATRGAPVVYLASASNFPDALSAGPAAAEQGGPLLLTTTSTLFPATRAEIIRLHPGKIVVVGGVGVISAGLFNGLRALAPSVVRVAGSDRYATSRAVVNYAFSTGSVTQLYLATGATYADAVSATGVGASMGLPVLLTPGNLPKADAPTVQELHKLGVKSVTILGEAGAVSVGIAGSLGSGITVKRDGGIDRYATGISVNRDAFHLADSVYLSTGANFPDALSASVLEGRNAGPVYLLDPGRNCVPLEVLTDIQGLHATKVVVLGATGALPEAMDTLTACSAPNA